MKLLFSRFHKHKERIEGARRNHTVCAKATKPMRIEVDEKMKRKNSIKQSLFCYYKYVYKLIFSFHYNLWPRTLIPRNNMCISATIHIKPPCVNLIFLKQNEKSGKCAQDFSFVLFLSICVAISLHAY